MLLVRHQIAVTLSFNIHLPGPSPVCVSAWQHVLPEAEVEVVEYVRLGLRDINNRQTDNTTKHSTTVHSQRTHCPRHQTQQCKRAAAAPAIHTASAASCCLVASRWSPTHVDVVEGLWCEAQGDAVISHHLKHPDSQQAGRSSTQAANSESVSY
jgi:hypothetical protein